jgi:hypothetical protein
MKSLCVFVIAWSVLGCGRPSPPDHNNTPSLSLFGTYKMKGKVPGEVALGKTPADWYKMSLGDEGVDETKMKKLSKSGAAFSVREGTSVQITGLDSSGAIKVSILEGPHKNRIGWTYSGFLE